MLSLILIILTLHFLLHFCVDLLNISHLKPQLPKEMEGHFDKEKYERSQRYSKDQTILSLFSETFSFVLTIAFICIGGFNLVDVWLRELTTHPLILPALFLAAISLLNFVVQLPFSLYHTFVLEARYGFNQTSPSLYLSDLWKKGLLFALLALPIFSFITAIFEAYPQQAWYLAFAAVLALQLIFMYLAPTLIMPLFNTFTPLEEGPLKEAIENYAKKENFPLKELSTMDGSKRSSKSNAFFTGFGKNKKLVLFDTLIKNHSTEELLAVVAHEMGHYKRRHIPRIIALSLFQAFVMFYLLSYFIKNPALFQAFGMLHLSTYASLLFFTFLFTPISFFFSIISNILLRKYEYEADAYACLSTGDKIPMITALKKLASDNLSNLTPHPLKVWLEASHPPVLQRIEAIKRL